VNFLCAVRQVPQSFLFPKVFILLFLQLITFRTSLYFFSVKFFTSPFCHPLPIFKSSRRRLMKRCKTKNSKSHLPLATFCKILCTEEEVCLNQYGPVVGKNKSATGAVCSIVNSVRESHYISANQFCLNLNHFKRNYSNLSKANGSQFIFQQCR